MKVYLELDTNKTDFFTAMQIHTPPRRQQSLDRQSTSFIVNIAGGREYYDNHAVPGPDRQTNAYLQIWQLEAIESSDGRAFQSYFNSP